MKLNSRLQKVVAKHFKKQVNKISLNSSKDSIDEWDSLEHIKLILTVEDEFNIRFSLEAIPKITSVKLIQNEMEILLAEGSPINAK